MAEAVIFVGLQGSGKTTYFTKHFADTHAHASRDVQQTPEREEAFVRESLCSGRSFVLDDTNATRAVRAQYIRAAKAAGFYVIAYFFDTPVRTAIGRNNHRKDKKPIPVPAILRTAKRLEPPSLEEGIDEIRTIAAEIKDPTES
ncbi:MAG: AAA family ATPase [Acidobacteriaceae bacterium]|nr:AAA family ATPase [Acidobacteriaceae bacterium]MBV9764491.1 AAA family ATPase [Acidobacteriaceae bacterium]